MGEALSVQGALVPDIMKVCTATTSINIKERPRNASLERVRDVVVGAGILMCNGK